MEENLAILMADLSGYTALTETHGAVSAADLIDKYLHLVEACLVGDSRLHERTGDEVMIVSTSPDFLLATALMILERTSTEENFLQVHGGMHYGKLLKRRNSFFGTAINLTSRIAARANPCTFLCSEEFVNALSGECPTKLQSKGKHSFKNLSDEREVYELKTDREHSFFVDPVCRMLIVNTDKAISHPASSGIFFCSISCLAIYTKNQLAISKE